MNNGCVYLRDNGHAYGRVSLAHVMEWMRSGQVTETAEVSLDSTRWMPISQLMQQSAARAESGQSGETADPTRPELRRILRRIQGCVRTLPRLFGGVVGAVFCGAGTAAFTLTMWLVSMFHESLLVMVAVAAVPGLLIGMALGHVAGNITLRRYTGLTKLERRCLALHLPWCRTPKYWPEYLRRWIYNGDWLIDAQSYQLLPYVRAFITGKTPQTIEEELQIWNELMARTRKSASPELEVGQSIRELACVAKLPEWTREIDPGMSLDQLQKTLGKVGHDWAVSLLRRAGTRMPDLQELDPEKDLENVTFEFHHCQMSDERSGLLVILRPHDPKKTPDTREPHSSAA